MALLATTDEELQRRLGLWRELIQRGGPQGVAAAVVNHKGLCLVKGGRGIWRDADRTVPISPETHGLAVGIQLTGTKYVDDLYDDGVIYHYPSGMAPTDDARDIMSMKGACAASLPVFVVVKRGLLRDVHLGWIESWEDEAAWFSILFGEQGTIELPLDYPEADFSLFDDTPQRSLSRVASRPNQRAFKVGTFARYGTRCAFCSVCDKRLLDAAHVVAKKDRGSDDPRNGLVLCPTHHRAFDRQMLSIDPQSFDVLATSDRSLEDLGVTTRNLRESRAQPHPDALRHRWTT
tara:strand:- start:76 stop:948 length:873 start_codon:yes stop_codon:yes gene_type:complete